MTPDYLLDTNVCIAIRDLLADKAPQSVERRQRIDKLRARWGQVAVERLAMSLVTLGELSFGVAKSKQRAAAQVHLDALRRVLPVITPDERTAARYGEVRAELESQGQKIGPNDTWIAAHALADRRTVVTNNTGEFSRVSGLVVEDWMA